MKKSTMFVAPLLAAGLALAPLPALAQTCLGVPTLERQTALQGSVVFNGGATAYGGDLRANLPGPLALGLGGQIVDIDDVSENVREIRGDVSIDFGHRELSVCPVVGVSYSSWRDDFLEVTLDLSEVRVPAALGLGTRLALDDAFVFMPSVLLGGYWYRVRDGVELNGTVESGRESGTELFGEAGVTLGLGQLYLRGAVLGDGRDDMETRYRVSLGFVF